MALLERALLGYVWQSPF